MVSGWIRATKYLDGIILINLQPDSTVSVKLNPEHYYATFYVSSKGLPFINAQIIIEGIDTVCTGLNGYAISFFIPFVKNIPYQVKDKDYHTFTRTFGLWNTNTLVTVNLNRLGTTDDIKLPHPEVFPSPLSDTSSLIGQNALRYSFSTSTEGRCIEMIILKNRVGISRLHKAI